MTAPKDSPTLPGATGGDKSAAGAKPGKTGISVLDSFTAHQSALRGFISRFTISSHDIEDVSQETFLRAYQAERETRIEQPKAFLFRVAKNLLLSEYRRKCYKVTDYLDDLEIAESLSDGDTVEDNVMAQQKLDIYCEAIASLPPQCRRVVLMRKVYDMPVKEIARRLGVTSSTVEKHMTKGLRDCKRVLAKRYNNTGVLKPARPVNIGRNASAGDKADAEGAGRER